MKIFLVVIIGVFSLFFISCENNHNNLEDNSFLYGSNTKITYGDNLTSITNNKQSESEFSCENSLNFGENVNFNKGYLSSRINEDIWYVPYNMDKEPIWLSYEYSQPKIQKIECKCGGGTIDYCVVESATSGNNTVEFYCTGGCADGGCCGMSVFVEQENEGVRVKLDSPVNGILISANKLKYNGRIYEKK